MFRAIFCFFGALMLAGCVAPSGIVPVDKQALAGEYPAFSTTIEVVVEKGTNALAFVPNATGHNFANGRPAVGIALLGPGEVYPADDNFVIHRVRLDIPAGTRQGVLCTGSMPGEGYHAIFSPARVARWRAGEKKDGLVAIISTADRDRLGPTAAAIEKMRGFPKSP